MLQTGNGCPPRNRDRATRPYERSRHGCVRLHREDDPLRDARGTRELRASIRKSRSGQPYETKKVFRALVALLTKASTVAHAHQLRTPLLLLHVAVCKDHHHGTGIPQHAGSVNTTPSGQPRIGSGSDLHPVDALKWQSRRSCGRMICRIWDGPLALTYLLELRQPI